MPSSTLRLTLVITVVACALSPAALAQQKREPEGGALPPYAKVLRPPGDRGPDFPVSMVRNGLPNIMITGYWPPTNEMLRPFSTNPDQNPEGWVGENWEGRGYNIYSFFPEFPGGLGKGEGDFEVDYQDTSADWWYLIEQIQPIAVITTGRADFDYDWELEGGHRMYELFIWADDYLEPFKPTPELPIADETPGTERDSTLPLQAIVDAVTAEVPNVDPYFTSLDTSNFLCNFVGYHATWYHNLHSNPHDPAFNFAAGHIHVGFHMELEDAVLATEVTLRTLTDYLDAELPVRGDFDGDRDVDGDDYTAFHDCYTTCGGGPITPECLPADFDVDGDVDCLDWNQFMLAWTEPGHPPVFADCYVAAPLPASYPHNRAKNRYLSFDPNKAENDGIDVAFQVTLTSLGLGSCDGSGSPDVEGWACRTDDDCRACSLDANPCWTAPLHCGQVPDPQTCDVTGAHCVNDQAGSVGMLWWVGPESPLGNGVHLLVSEAYRKVSPDWPAAVHVSDCEVVPVANYSIRTTDLASGANSFDLLVGTTPRPDRYWADCVGPVGDYCEGNWRACVTSADCEVCYNWNATPTGDPNNASSLTPCTSDADCPAPGEFCGANCVTQWPPPDGFTNVHDINAAVFTFSGLPTVTSTDVPNIDLHGDAGGDANVSPPNYIVNFNDIGLLVKAFEGWPYPYSDPAECP